MTTPITTEHWLRRFAYVVLATGILWGIISYYWEIPAAPIEIVFPIAVLACSFVLLRQGAYLAAVITGIFSLVFLFATVIIGELVTVKFGVEQSNLVFHEPMKSQALHAFLAFTCTLALLLLHSAPRTALWEQEHLGEKPFARSTWWFFLVLSILVSAANLRGTVITEAGYHSAEWIRRGYQADAGLDALSTMLGIWSVIAALRGFGSSHKLFYLAILVFISETFYFRLLRGERSTTFGVLIFLVLLYHSVSSSKWKNTVVVSMVPVGFLFLLIWAGVRGIAEEYGLLGAMQESFTQAWKVVSNADLMQMDKLPKATWDVLETAFLYDEGIRRAGETYLNLIPQTVPEFLANIIGFERPTSEPWILAKYFAHGGGIFMVAEAYWNFGLVGTIGLAVVLAFLCFWMERLYRRLPPMLTYGYFAIIAICASNVFTGVQAFARGIEIAIFVTIVGWLLLQISRKYVPPPSSHLRHLGDGVTNRQIGTGRG